MDFKPVFRAPEIRLGRTRGSIHTVEMASTGFGAVCCAGTGLVLLSYDGGESFEDRSWYSNKATSWKAPDTFDSAFEDPWVTPKAMRIYSRNLIRILGCWNNEVGIFETWTAGAQWTRVAVYRSQDDTESLLAGPALLLGNADGLFVVETEADHILYRFDSFGKATRLATWDTSELENVSCLLACADEGLGVLVFSTWRPCRHPSGREKRSSVYVTTDHGHTWQAGRDFDECVRVIAAAPGGKIWIGGNEGLLSSSDDGFDWRPVALPSAPDITAIHPVTPDRVVVAGHQGFLGVHSADRTELHDISGPNLDSPWEAILQTDSGKILLAEPSILWLSEVP